MQTSSSQTGKEPVLSWRQAAMAVGLIVIVFLLLFAWRSWRNAAPAPAAPPPTVVTATFVEPRDVPEAEVHLLVGVPANERMDWLVEKAAELGVRSIQPLQTSRSVLRLKGDRAERRQAHWQAVAISACEQSGRTRVPLIQPLRSLPEALAASAGRKAMLSLTAGSQPLHTWVAGQRPQQPVSLLSGPEGGLDAAEEALALQQGFEPITLGAHVLRAETAPLAALSLLQLLPDAQA